MIGFIILGISVLTSAIVGIFVVARSPKNVINQMYGLVTFSFIGISVANSMTIDPNEYQLIFIRLVIFFTTIAVSSLYFLILLMRQSYLKIALSSVGTKLIMVSSGIIAALDLSPFVFSSLTSGNDPTPVAEFGAPLFLAHFMAMLVLSITVLVKGIRHSDQKKERGQFRYMLLAIAPILLLAPLTSFVLPILLQQTNFIVATPLYTAYFVVMIGYAVIKYQLFDVRLAAVRTAAYALSLIVLAGIYYLLAYIVSLTLFQGQVSSAVSISPVNILLALVLAFAFQPIKSFFDKATDSIFYKDRYNSDEFYARLSEVLTTTTDLRNLLERASAEIGTTLKAEQAFFFVQYNHVHHVSSGTLHHSSLPLEDAHRLNEFVKKEGQDVIVAELLPEEHTIHRMLISHRVAIMMPLMRGGTVIGYLALGEQRSSGYTNRDIKVLKTISDELVIAIQNALSVQEVKDINIHLQQRIDTATAELRSSNTQLRHLDKTKDEFLSMASHQLRTPLTSVKGYLSMVLEGDAGKVTDAQKRLLGEAFTSSERMVHLIHDFLNVSRLQTGKFMLELHPYDLVKLVDEEVRSLLRAAESRNMKLEFINSIDTLMLNIDENKIRQVVMNYIDNALFYSHEDSTIRVELTMVGDQVELRVKDTGIGVPKSEQAHLFSKFYRATNARKQRPDGTGVGIFLAKKVIVEHGGEVLFESVEGKGSTFGFTLPIKKLAVSSDEKTDQPDQ